MDKNLVGEDRIPVLDMNENEEFEGCKKPRILCLTTSFPSSQGDPSGFFVYQLAEALAGQGLQVKVLSPQSNQRPARWPQSYEVYRFRYAPKRSQVLAQLPGGIPVALKSSKRNYLLLPSFLLSLALNILRLARQSDLILANWAFCGSLACWLFRLHRRPVITVLRGSDVKIERIDSKFNSFFLNMSLKYSKAVVCVGKELEEWVKNTARYPQEIHHIPNGIHGDFFHLGFPTPGPVINILFIGSLIPRKGVDVLLQAIQRISHLKVHVIIIGLGPLERQLKAMAGKLKIRHLVTFKGKVSPGVPIVKEMSGAHFLVLPSHHEGRPNVILEAMAAGRPVIGSNISGIRELVQDSITGYLFPEGDIGALSLAIEKLVRNPEDFHRMGQQARQWIMTQELTWEKTAKKYTRLIEKVRIPEG
jgi:glycosyltransferase involved in cell wall biosynthesis